MKLILNSQLEITDAPSSVKEQIKKALTLPNPKFLQLQKLGKPTTWCPKHIHFFDEDAHGSLIVPRGFLDQLMSIIRWSGCLTEVRDKRLVMQEVAFTFVGQLREYQFQAVKAMISHDHGLMVIPTGGGKTISMLNAICSTRQPTIVFVHSKELLYQWRDAAVKFLGMEPGDIGLVGDGHFTLGAVTIALIQTAAKRVKDLAPYFGMVVVDEAHKSASPTFMKTVSQFPAKYRYGCTATAIRADGQMDAVNFLLGSTRYEISKVTLLEEGHLSPCRFRQVDTGFWSDTNGSERYGQLMTDLINDDSRNERICNTIADHRGGGLSLILSGRVEHCQTLKDLLSARGIDGEVVTGKTPKKQRADVFEKVRAGKIRHLISTTALLKEGFDMPALQNLFLVYPVKWKGATIQMVGRILRTIDGKDHAEIIDFRDERMGILRNSASIRATTYLAEGIMPEPLRVLG